MLNGNDYTVPQLMRLECTPSHGPSTQADWDIVYHWSIGKVARLNACSKPSIENNKIKESGKKFLARYTLTR